jgi:hypothetical protein
MWFYSWASPKSTAAKFSELIVHRKAANGVQKPMRNEILEHVSPMRLWQALCGGTELPTGQYQHIIHCIACETLATQIGDALDDIETALRRHNIGVPGATHSASRLN